MKPTLIAVFAVVAGVTSDGLAQDGTPPAQPATQRTNVVARMPEPAEPFLVPLVRSPGTPVEQPPQLEPAGPVAGSSNGEEVTAQMGWSRETLDLRSAPTVSPRTNLPLSARGVLHKATKPERRGFGGFLAGFANLFNPFAPTDRGVSVQTEHWYDGQINTAPVPRAMRDERYHEPKTELVVLGIDPPVAPPEPVRKSE